MADENPNIKNPNIENQNLEKMFGNLTLNNKHNKVDKLLDCMSNIGIDDNKQLDILELLNLKVMSNTNLDDEYQELLKEKKGGKPKLTPLKLRKNATAPQLRKLAKSLNLRVTSQKGGYLNKTQLSKSISRTLRK